MNKKIIGICLLDEDDNVLKTVKLEATWKKDDAEFLSKLHHLKIEDAIADIVYIEIKNNLKPNHVRELLNEK